MLVVTPTSLAQLTFSMSLVKFQGEECKCLPTNLLSQSWTRGTQAKYLISLIKYESSGHIRSAMGKKKYKISTWAPYFHSYHVKSSGPKNLLDQCFTKHSPKMTSLESPRSLLAISGLKDLQDIGLSCHSGTTSGILKQSYDSISFTPPGFF